jgi:hypothetical protein
MMTVFWFRRLTGQLDEDDRQAIDMRLLKIGIIWLVR